MRLFISKNKKSGDKKAFKLIKEQILRKKDALIGLAVGKTTDSLYSLISKDVTKNKQSWKKVKLFQIDENLGIPSSSPLSFNYEIRKELSNLFKIVNPKNIFLIDGRDKPHITIKKAYKFLKLHGGIDLLILGIGPEYDPHIAYNTTGKSSLDSKMRMVELHPTVRACRGKPYGITIGIKDILNAKKIAIINGRLKSTPMRKT